MLVLFQFSDYAVESSMAFYGFYSHLFPTTATSMDPRIVVYLTETNLASVVRRVDNTNHKINRDPLDSVVRLGPELFQTQLVTTRNEKATHTVNIPIT